MSVSHRSWLGKTAVLLSMVWARPERITRVCEWISEIEGQFEWILVFADRKQVPVHVPHHAMVCFANTPKALRRLLKQLTQAAIVQALSEQDYRQVAWALAWVRKRPFLLMTHWPDTVIAKTRWNHWLFNRLAEVNLIMDSAPGADRTKKGQLFLHNPMFLQRAPEEQNGVGTMLEYCYQSLLNCSKRGIFAKENRDYSDIKLTYITHFYCNQNDIRSVTRLLERYASYSQDVIGRVQFVIVDDGSPIDYEIPNISLNLVWIRINQDIRWNQAGARNVGALYAKADTILLTDLDHEVPEETMRRLIARSSCGKRLYKMYRKDSQGQIYKGHSNFFVMSRGRFFECFGYDEEYAGHYGAEDIRFVKYHKARGTLQCYLPKTLWCFERTDINREKSYHSLVRDLTFNTPVDSRKRRELSDLGQGYGHSRMFLNFTWTVCCDRQMDVVIERPINKGWKRRMLWRQLLPRF